MDELGWKEGQLEAMFSLSCAHTGRETSAHKKTWKLNAHKIFLPEMLLRLFHTRHSEFR